MEGIKFVDVLKSFEEKTEGEDYERPRKDYDGRKIIENDVKRTTFIGVDRKNRKKVKSLQKILFESLDRIPNKYTQGMSEIASVFVLHYFEDIVNKEVESKSEEKKDSDVSDDEGYQEQESRKEIADDNSVVLNSTEQFIVPPEEERIEFESFESKHGAKLEKLVVVLTNVFRRKFEPLVADDFKLYKENIRVFVEMMKKRGVRIPELESHRFMGCIFTFFLRNISNREDVQKVFEIVLSCPTTCPFLLLAVFYRKVSNNEAIESVGDDLFPKIIKLEEEFIETERKINSVDSGFSVRNALLFGGVVSVVAAVLVYRMSKKE